MDKPLPHLEIGASREDAELCIILMHGLGDTGHGFEDVAEAIAIAAEPRKWRFVLPHAPSMPVTINMGMVMPAWYDILDMSQPREVNWETVDQSQAAIEQLLSAELAPKVVLAGFSQGAAMSLHVGLRNQDKIAGLLLMSGYLLESEAYPCPEKLAEFPIGIFHGSDDGVVPLTAAEKTHGVLESKSYTPTIQVYDGVEHSLCEDEIRDVFGWISAI